MDELLKLMHDTMSPVNTIKGAIDLIQEGRLSKEEFNKLCDGIRERANSLNAILDSYFTNERSKLKK